jgi:hypothetical protein
MGGTPPQGLSHLLGAGREDTVAQGHSTSSRTNAEMVEATINSIVLGLDKKRVCRLGGKKRTSGDVGDIQWLNICLGYCRRTQDKKERESRIQEMVLEATHVAGP